LWGLRDTKYRWLNAHSVSDTDWQELLPKSPYYFFVPKISEFDSEYNEFLKITEIMPVHSTGILTARDRFVIDFDKTPILNRIKTFLDRRLSNDEVQDQLELSENYAWRISDARQALGSEDDPEAFIRNIYYRPFDIRKIIYHPAVVWRIRDKVMKSLSREGNIALITSRMTKGEDFAHALISRDIVEVISISPKTSNNAFVYPLFVHGKGESLFSSDSAPNFDPKFLNNLAAALKLPQDGPHGLPNSLEPENIIYYAYSIFYSPSYRERYKEQLKFDFPRLPLTGQRNLFNALAQLGNELAEIHLLESPQLDITLTKLNCPKNPMVGQVGWSDDTVWLDAKKTNARAGQRAVTPGSIGFRGVPEAVWDFRIGGYQVCHKWLKDRKSRRLSDNDVEHYEKIISAISETIRIMGEIDEVTEEHGGWPDAFKAKKLR